MKRLKGFDYSKPYFYMVTLKRVKGLRPFCEITKEKEPPSDTKGRVRYLVANEITEEFAQVIREFHTKWWGLWPIDCFIVMPDHLHLLIHIKDTGDQLALVTVSTVTVHSTVSAALSGSAAGFSPIFSMSLWNSRRMSSG